jgi:DNA polymerase-3 subunit beta
MKFTLPRETLLKPLQTVCGVVERRQTLPILSNVLVRAERDVLRFTATDLEVELVARTTMDGGEPGETTVSARKLADICRALPEGSLIEISESKNKLVLKSGRSRFSLSTLPVNDFPTVQNINAGVTFSIGSAAFKRAIDKTQFAMAQQDVRYYLNGLLLEINGDRLRMVATDGHRLSLCDSTVVSEATQLVQAILPRKGVSELQRLMTESDEMVTVMLGENHARIELGHATFTSKLIDGKFPEYEKVIPAGATKRVIGGRETIKQALHRTSILSNEKYRGIRLKLDTGSITASANNPELEEAEETVEVDYMGEAMEIGFNVNYVLDALSAVGTDDVELLFTDSNSSCLIQPRGENDNRHVVMPMRL